MKREHPLDEVFRRRLEAYEVDTPPYLWDQIEGKRNLQYRTFRRVRKRLPIILIFILIFATSILYLLHATQSTTLFAFPIPLEIDHDQITADAVDIVSKCEPESTKTKAIPPAKAVAELPLVAQVQKIKLHSEEHIVADKVLKPTIRSVAPPAFSGRLTEPDITENLYPGKSKIRLFAPSPKCPHFGSSGGNFFLEALFSPELPFRTITTTRPELEEYVALRKSSEKQEFAYSTSLRLSFKPNKNIAIRTGLSYAQINEEFNYFNENEVRTIINEIYNAQGELIGVDTTIEVGTRYKITNNKYRMLDVPILLGYEFTAGPFILSMNTGALINIAFRQKGDVLSPDDLSPVSINSGETSAYPAFKQRVGLGWYGSVGMTYPITPDIELVVEPYLRAYSESLTKDQFGVNQKYINAGIYLGLKKQL